MRKLYRSSSPGERTVEANSKNEKQAGKHGSNGNSLTNAFRHGCGDYSVPGSRAMMVHLSYRRARHLLGQGTCPGPALPHPGSFEREPACGPGFQVQGIRAKRGL